ncbi:MAG: hypothetical protein K0B09_15160, partial [Bacteroidales bacterium]|nr:hypothetical protein [Bacteroidales bacterium]
MKKTFQTIKRVCWRALAFSLFMMTGFLTYGQWDPNGNPANWITQDVFDNPTYVHVIDAFGGDGVSTVDNQFTQGSTDYEFKSWSLSQVKNKNDIANGHAVLIGTRLYFAGDRLAIEGSAQIGFWFFRGGTAPVMEPGAKFGTFEPLRQVGDILVLSDFSGGGRYANVTVLRIVGFTPDSKRAAIFEELDAGTSIVAINNENVYDVPDAWPYISPTYPINAFYEGYLDLALIPPMEGMEEEVDLCFGSFLLETRSSFRLTASLDDFVWGNFTTIPEIWAEGDAGCA